MLRPLQIQRQQPLQNLLIGQITLPPIRGEDGSIELFVSKIELGGTGVVEVGDGAFLIRFGLRFVRQLETARSDSHLKGDCHLVFRFKQAYKRIHI